MERGGIVVEVKITAGAETLYEGLLENDKGVRSTYLGELKQLANSSLTMGVEVVCG